MSNITLPLGIDSLEVISQRIDNKGTVRLTVKSKNTKTKCYKCGKDTTKRFGYSGMLEIKHTSVFDKPVILEIKPVRYECEHCDNHTTTTEKYDWVADGGKITKGLEEYILRCVINSTIHDVSRKEKISYSTISTVLNHKVGNDINWNNIKDLHTIGIDEMASSS